MATIGVDYRSGVLLPGRNSSLELHLFGLNKSTSTLTMVKEKRAAKKVSAYAFSPEPSTPLEESSLEQTPSSQAEPEQPTPERMALLGDSYMELTPGPQSEARPKTSPYASPPVTIFIGPSHKKHYVPRDLLRNPDWVTSSGSQGDGIQLLDVDESTGHVLIHYLYTGAYQTLDDIETSAKEIHAKFKSAVLVYIAAKTYKLDGLQQLAKHKTEQFGTDINIFDTVEIVEKYFSKLSVDTTWFHDYLDEKVKVAFEADHTVFAGNDFFDRINDASLIRVLSKCMAKLYENKISSLRNTDGQKVLDISEESASDVQDSLVQEALPEESCSIEETLLEPEATKEDERCAVVKESPIPSEPEPTFELEPEPELAKADDSWGWDIGATKEIIDEPKVEEPYFPPSESVVPPTTDDDWDKKEEPEPSVPEPEPEPEPEPIVEEVKEEPKINPFAGLSKIKRKKLEKKMKADGARLAKEALSQPTDPEPVAGEPAPESEPEAKPASYGWGDWLPPPPPPEPGLEPEPIPILEPGNTKGGDWGFSSIWGGGEKKKGKIAEHASIPRPDPEPEPVVEYSATAEAICPFRADHLMGDKWKDCKKCRAMLCLVAIQIARSDHSDEEGYEIVGQMLMK
ncbi:hypothetical protein BS50DRAFT_626910 [Corynespora cassiicola Philippines]|uniref:BTB domain-containing protein n=1 Tax=Corynespora cassiicola Philippines TaxID=1448308 RepID=A0A2T2N1B9_CORCC|nr:hypothetical protein BS50DRAFT_626910 [Corynespora cassiicola Philippines]